MRESEFERVDEIEGSVHEDLADLKADVERQIIERLVAAALTFACEVPDAPRRERANA